MSDQQPESAPDPLDDLAQQDLDDLSEHELEEMLREAERSLRDIRAEITERRVMAHAGIEMEMPEHDLREARGRWHHFFEFVRDLSHQGATQQQR